MPVLQSTTFNKWALITLLAVGYCRTYCKQKSTTLIIYNPFSEKLHYDLSYAIRVIRVIRFNSCNSYLSKE